MGRENLWYASWQWAGGMLAYDESVLAARFPSRVAAELFVGNRIHMCQANQTLSLSIYQSPFPYHSHNTSDSNCHGYDIYICTHQVTKPYWKKKKV